MKKLLVFTLALSIISMALMVFHFLALTDIYHDYIGTSIIARGIAGNIDKLPEWTSCKLEWRILCIDNIIRIIFMVGVTVVLIKLSRREK
jgi:hypothetical protein